MQLCDELGIGISKLGVHKKNYVLYLSAIQISCVSFRKDSYEIYCDYNCFKS